MIPRIGVTLLAVVFAACGARGAGVFSVAALTGDADSGIAADSAFTHAINVFDAANVKINGAVFTGSGGGANPATNDYSTTGFASGFTGFDALANDGIGGGVSGLMTNFLYNGNPETVTLRNLRVGQQYETVFYSAAFGGPGVRFQTIAASDGGSMVFDQNGLPGSLLKYAFTAAGTTMTFTITPDTANTFHQYAFSNRAVGPKALLTDNFYAPSNPNLGAPAKRASTRVKVPSVQLDGSAPQTVPTASPRGGVGSRHGVEPAGRNEHMNHINEPRNNPPGSRTPRDWVKAAESISRPTVAGNDNGPAGSAWATCREVKRG